MARSWTIVVHSLWFKGGDQWQLEQVTNVRVALTDIATILTLTGLFSDSVPHLSIDFLLKFKQDVN